MGFFVVGLAVVVVGEGAKDGGEVAGECGAFWVALGVEVAGWFGRGGWRGCVGGGRGVARLLLV